MNLSLTFRRPEPSLFRRKPSSPIKYPQKQKPPSFPHPKTQFRVMAKKRLPIEGLTKEMNAMAAQNLDHAPARRQVRSAFIDVHQQLDHCLFKMDHAGIRTEEWYGRNSKGIEIFCKSWLPKVKPGDRIKGGLCFCHGYGSTCTFFFEGIAKRIAASGYAVYAVDYPGFGLSEGLHGYIQNFDELVQDVLEQFTNIKGRPEVKGLPFFIMGESMGGAVTLKIHLNEPKKWDGVILVAPMCKIAEEVMPPPIVLKLLALTSQVLPQAKLFPQKDISDLSYRDPIKRKTAGYNVISYKDQMRSRTAVELLKATSDIEAQLEKVSAPLLILHGAEDKVTDPLVSQLLYEKASSKDKTLKLYQDGYHCILQGEPDDIIFTALDDIVTWLDSRCSQEERNKDIPKLQIMCSIKSGLSHRKLQSINSTTSPAYSEDFVEWCLMLHFLARLIGYIAVLTLLMIVAFMVMKYITGFEEETSTEIVTAGIIETHPLQLAGKAMPLTYGTCDEWDIEAGNCSASSGIGDSSNLITTSSEDLYDGKICVICYTEQRDCFLVPCGHCATCYVCAQRIFYGESKTCPICRRLIRKVRKLFAA